MRENLSGQLYARTLLIGGPTSELARMRSKPYQAPHPGLSQTITKTFIKDDKEQYICTLRDMSLEDIQTLRRIDTFHKLPSAQCASQKGVPKSENASLSRLASLGLIHETIAMRDFNLSIPTVPLSRQSPEGYTRGLADAFKHYMEKAPTASYRLSGFGQGFLAFIKSASPGENAVS